MSALAKIQEAGFVISLTDTGFDVTPSKKLTQSQREFLKEHKAEIVSELKGAEVVAANPDIETIKAWLASIGEDDPETIKGVLDKCANDPEAYSYYIGRAKGEMPKPKPSAKQPKKTVTCFTPAGNPVEVMPDSPDHEKFLVAMNPALPDQVQCMACQHFKSHNQHGRGAGVCNTGVTPKGITHWFDTQHSCNQFIHL